MTVEAPAPIADPDHIALSPMQRMTITRLRAGQAGAVPVTITAPARADRLLGERAAAQTWAGSRSRVTLTVLLAKLLIGTLMEHPRMRVSLVDDETLARHHGVNLGVATALPDGGLVVPVIHAAQELDVPSLADGISDLVSRGRIKKLTPLDVRGGTFTLSSTGSVRVPVFGTPLLSGGQAGILLVGAAAAVPVLDEDGSVVGGHVLPLSLTFDHAVINGVPALEFLADLVSRIEHPQRWLAIDAEGDSA